MTRSKYVLKHEDGRSEPIKDLDNASRLVIVDEERVGAEDITFIYLKWEARTSTHKRHIHEDAEEVMYILSGRARGGVGDGAEEVEFTQGDTVWVPRGMVHWADNPFDEPVEMLCVYTRPSLKSAGYTVTG